MAYVSCKTTTDGKTCYSKLIKCQKCGSVGCEMSKDTCSNGLRETGRCKVCGKGISMWDFKPLDL